MLVLCATLTVALWQNHALLRILNDPLKETTKSAAQNAKAPLGAQARYDLQQREVLRRSRDANFLSQSRAALSPLRAHPLVAAAKASGSALKAAPKEVTGRQPVTLGLGEPFEDAHRVVLLRPALRAAADPLPGLRVRVTGLQPPRSAGWPSR